MSSSLRVINNRYIIGGVGYTEGLWETVWGRGSRLEDEGWKGTRERAAAHLRPAERGWRGNDGKEGERGRTVARARGCGRGSDLHKYIEFIEMSLGIAARRILAAYQPPRRFIPSSTLFPLPPPLLPSPMLLLSPTSSSSSLAFIKIAGLIYAAR